MDRTWVTAAVISAGAAATAVTHRLAIRSIISGLRKRFKTVDVRHDSLQRLTSTGRQPIYVTNISGEKVTVKGTGWKGLASAKSFASEVQALAAVQPHPNIPKLQGITVTSDLGFGMVYRFAKGVTLHAYLRDISNEVTDTLKFKILCELVDTMAHLHSRGVAHRDLKPLNIVIDPATSKLQIIDFGSAARISDGGFFHSLSAQPEVGTNEYMAPEAWSSGISLKSDVYSFALVLAEMLSRKDPWSDSDRKLLPFVLETKRPELVVNSPVDIAIAHIVRLCWAQDPSERPSFDALQRYLVSVNASFEKCDANHDDILSTAEFEDAFQTPFPTWMSGPEMTRHDFLYLIQNLSTLPRSNSNLLPPPLSVC